MRNYYRGKRDQMLKAFQNSKLASRIAIREEDAGLHFLLSVNTELTDEKVEEKAREKGIGISSLSRYYYESASAAEHVFVINYSGIEEDRMEEAVSRLVEVFER